MFLLITRKVTEDIERKLRSLLASKIDAYVVSDEEPIIESKRIVHYPDSFMQEIGWTHHMSQAKNKITAWDKATYHAYKSGAKYVWICEDDVFWNKPSVLKKILAHESNADLIAYPLAPSYAEMPDWYHWEKVQMITLNKKHWIATYNQLCRLSNRVLAKMADLSAKRHRLYFHEGMFGTLCKMNDYPIEYYNSLPGIYFLVRWNHPFTQEDIDELVHTHKHVLLHPVKMELL